MASRFTETQRSESLQWQDLGPHQPAYDAVLAELAEAGAGRMIWSRDG